MGLLNNRVIYKDNTVYTDYSRELCDIKAAGKAFTIVAAEDALYVGSELPFNHRWFNIPTVNSTSGSVSVSIWDGSAWQAVAEVIDMTAVNGVPFAQDGIIMWTPNKDNGWGRAASTEDISELSSFKIYNYYWAKLTFSAAFAFTLNYVGHKFAKDQDLEEYYGDLNRASAREQFFEAVTTNWDKVLVSAAEELIEDLRTDRVLVSRNQILEPDLFKMANIHKMAEMVYSSYGPSHVDRLEFAQAKYKEAIARRPLNIDANMNGKREFSEGIQSRRIIRR